MKRGMRVSLGPGHIVLDGDPAAARPNGGRSHPPAQFLTHIWCGQMAAGIKMPLHTEVGLGPGNFVLDGDPHPSPSGAESP